MPKDNNFTIVFDKFFQGYSPTFFENSNSTFGNAGMANDMEDIDLLDPTHITQGPSVADLTAGSEGGAVTDLVNFILDRAVTADKSYAVSDTKLHEISATAVTNAGNFPHTISNSTEGSSIAVLKGKLFYFYNKSSGADCGRFDLASTFQDAYFSTNVGTGAGALEKAPHPSATKEDLMVFGNGRYVGKYTSSTDTLERQKLDFGTDAIVSDVVFHQNKWWLAVNRPNLTGNNRSLSQIYIWDGSGIPTTLEDETAVGLQRIGFLTVVSGVIWLAYEDLSSNTFKIGYLSGPRIIQTGVYNGSLPLFNQKTLYKNSLLFVAGTKIFSHGSLTPELPFQTSQIARGKYSTNVGGLAAPFGTPLIGSDNASNYSLAKFNNYSVNTTWTSLLMQISQGRHLGYIDELIVTTEAFASGGRVDMTLKYNDENSNSGAKTINTASTRRHIFKNISASSIENLRLVMDWTNGSATIPVKVKKVEVVGHHQRV